MPPVSDADQQERGPMRPLPDSERGWGGCVPIPPMPPNPALTFASHPHPDACVNATPSGCHGREGGVGQHREQGANFRMEMPPGTGGDCNGPSRHYASHCRFVIAGGQGMANPLTSLTKTVVMGVILTVIMVAILAAVS